MTRSLFPILTTPDLERTLRFYRDGLGGSVTYQFPAEGQPGYVGLDLGESHLGIGVGDAVAGPQRIQLWVYVANCDETLERLRDGGVEVVEEPSDQPWGERVARVLDPDGNTVHVAS